MRINIELPAVAEIKDLERNLKTRYRKEFAEHQLGWLIFALRRHFGGLFENEKCSPAAAPFNRLVQTIGYIAVGRSKFTLARDADGPKLIPD